MRHALATASADCAALLVDLDGTLYRQRPIQVLMALELLLLGRPAIRPLLTFRREHERLRFRSAEHLAEANVGDSPFEEQLRAAAAKLRMEPARLRGIVEEWMFRRPEKWLRFFARRDLADELRRQQTRGTKLAVVSDYPARRKLAALAIPVEFDAIVASGEPDGPRALKPDPDGYLLAASRLGVPPAKCLVIGDRANVDGAAAQRAGMRFFLIR